MRVAWYPNQALGLKNGTEAGILLSSLGSKTTTCWAVQGVWAIVLRGSGVQVHASEPLDAVPSSAVEMTAGTGYCF